MAGPGSRAVGSAGGGSSSGGKRGREERGPGPTAEEDFEAFLGQFGVGVGAAAPSPSGAVVGFSCRSHPARLRESLEHALEANDAAQDSCILGLEDMLSRTELLHRALLPLVLAPTSAPSFAGTLNHESLVKVLLKVDCVQARVARLLLERLPSLSAEMEQNSTSRSDKRVEDLPRLVMHQLRWMDHLVDSSALTESILECMEVLSPDLQRDLIGYLPQIVEDKDYARVVEHLGDLTQDDPSMLTSVLDAYSSLPLPRQLLDTIVLDMLHLLESTDAGDLPMLLQFLLGSAGPETLQLVVQNLRAKLQLVPNDIPRRGNGYGDVLGGYGEEDTDSHEAETALQISSLHAAGTQKQSHDALTLDQMRHGLQLRPDVAKEFIKAIAASDGSGCHSAVDIWVLLCLHDSQQHGMKALRLFKKKVVRGCFTQALLAEAIEGRGGALENLFGSLLLLADALMREPQQAARRFGGRLYGLMFEHFPERYRQETLGALMTHIGSASCGEVDCALDVLEAAPTDLLRQFNPLLIGLLEPLKDLNNAQMRSVFRVLCRIECDLGVFISKNCHLNDMFFKRMGIAGALASAAHLGSARLLTSRRLSDATHLLDMARSSVENHSEAAAFFYNELCGIVTDASVSRDLVEMIGGFGADPLEKTFFDVISTTTGDLQRVHDMECCGTKIQVQYQHNLNGEGGEIALNLIKLLSSGDSRKRYEVRCLCPLLQLTTLATRSLQPDLNRIDALIGIASPECMHPVTLFLTFGHLLSSPTGAPMLLPTIGTVNQAKTASPPAQDLICRAFYGAVDWCRELINGFILESATQRVLVHRLDTLIQLEKDLIMLIGWCPLFDCGLPSSNATPAKQTSKGRKGKGKGKRKAAPDDKPQSEVIRQHLRATMRPLCRSVPLVLGFPAAADVDPYVARLLTEELLKHLSIALKSSKRKVKVPATPRSQLAYSFEIHLEPVELVTAYLDGGVFRALGQQFCDIEAILCGGNVETAAPMNIDYQEVELRPMLKLILDITQVLCSSAELMDTHASRATLKSALGCMIGSSEEFATGDVLADLAGHFQDLAPHVTQLSMAVHLLTTVELLLNTRRAVNSFSSSASQARLNPELPLRQSLGRMSFALLQRNWEAYRTSTVQFLVAQYLRNTPTMDLIEDEDGEEAEFNCPHILNTIEHLIEEVLDPFSVEASMSSAVNERFPTLTPSTFVFWVTPVLMQLNCVWGCFQLDPEAYPVVEDEPESAAADPLAFTLHMCNRVCKAFSRLIAYTKVVENMELFYSVLKEGCTFMSVLISKENFFDKACAKYQAEYLSLVKSAVQTVTRQLQSLINYAKRHQISNLLRLTPQAAKVMEQFIFSVKKISKNNKIESAMQIGTLRQRRPDGSFVPDEPEEESDSGPSSSNDDDDDDEDEEEEGDGQDHNPKTARPAASDYESDEDTIEVGGYSDDE
jgi:hypothetical protein